MNALITSTWSYLPSTQTVLLINCLVVGDGAGRLAPSLVVGGAGRLAPSGVVSISFVGDPSVVGGVVAGRLAW